MNRRPAGAWQLRPTPFGLVALGVLVVTPLVAPGVTDVAVAGMVWAGLAGLLLAAAVAPPAVVGLLRPEVVGAPSDAVAGGAVTVVVELGRLPSEVRVRWAGQTEGTWLAPGPRRRVELELPVHRRGAHTELQLELHSDAPFGVVRATRRATVALVRPLLVGPTPESVAAATGAVQEPGAGSAVSVHSSGEVVRSVRPYVAGDPSHLVHWPSTARAGAPVVRELEPPDDRGVALVVDLGPAPVGPPPPPSAPLLPEELGPERAAARAAGAARAVLAGGGRVVLCTVDADGKGIVAEVGGMGDVAHRLAVASGGAPPPPRPGWTAVRIAAADDVPGGGVPGGGVPGGEVSAR